jgi:hypothetical protein
VGVWRVLGKVIFVDGLPGSGKSTTAEYIAGVLKQRGLPCRLLRERETGHPLNVGGDLHPSGSTTGAQMFAAYSVSRFIEESLDRWSTFVAGAMSSRHVNVLDSYPFQNRVRVLLQMDADATTLAAYQGCVQEKVAGLDPVLIYLDPGDVARTIRAIAERRGSAWTDYAVAVITESPTHRPAACTGWTERPRSYAATSSCLTKPWPSPSPQPHPARFTTI